MQKADNTKNEDFTSEEITPLLNMHNVNSVRNMILSKKGCDPFFANNLSCLNAITDMNHHPYTRFYRGVYYYPDPIVFEREAGWRKLSNNPREYVPQTKPDFPNDCFQPACTTIYPCYSKYKKNTCVSTYR